MGLVRVYYTSSKFAHYITVKFAKTMGDRWGFSKRRPIVRTYFIDGASDKIPELNPVV